jgi:hypothetical protein
MILLNVGSATLQREFGGGSGNDDDDDDDDDDNDNDNNNNNNIYSFLLLSFLWLTFKKMNFLKRCSKKCSGITNLVNFGFLIFKKSSMFDRKYFRNEREFES